MVSEYIKPFRKVSDKKIVYDTKFRSSWNPSPGSPNKSPSGRPVGSTSGIKKPVIRSTARIGQGMRPRHFPVYGRPTGLQQNKVGGAIGRTTAKILANQKSQFTSTAVNMAIHQQNLARAAKISKGINIAGVVLTVGEGVYKGTKRALDNPEFHRGKAGKSYIDLSVKKPGKYGVDY